MIDWLTKQISKHESVIIIINKLSVPKKRNKN
jgi:hypothetical protein